MLSISIYNAQYHHCQTWLICLIKVIKLNKPDSPCVEADQDYSFTQCVRVFINQKIGCRIKYDGILGSDLRECQSPEEIGCEYLKLRLLWTSCFQKLPGAAVPADRPDQVRAGGCDPLPPSLLLLQIPSGLQTAGGKWIWY